MYNGAYPKIEYYLYNYNRISYRINNLNEQNEDIDYNHFSYSMWIKTKLNKGNSLENQIVNKINNECIIIKLNAWKNLIDNVIEKYRKKNKLFYKFIQLKYFLKFDTYKIKEKLNLSVKEQKDIQAKILKYIFLLAIKRNLLKEVKNPRIHKERR